MKIAAIKRVCMDARQFYIFNDGYGRQWIGTQSAAYPSEGVTFTEGNIAEMFDLTEKQSKKVSVTCRPIELSSLFCRDNVIGLDYARMRPGLPFRYLDEMLLPLEYRGNLYVILEKMVKAAASNGREYLDYFMGQNERGEPLVFISDGMIAAGIIRPIPESTTRTVKGWLARYGALIPGGPVVVEFEKREEKDELDGQIDMDEMLEDAQEEDTDE